MRASISVAVSNTRVVSLFEQLAVDPLRDRRASCRRVVEAISLFARAIEVLLNRIKLVTLLRSQRIKRSMGGAMAHNMGRARFSLVSCLTRTTVSKSRMLEAVNVFVARAANESSGLSSSSSEEGFLELRIVSLDQSSA